MDRLHGGNNAELREPADVLGATALDMLDGVAQALRPVFLLHRFEHVERLLHGSVADGVQADGITVRVGFLDHGVQIVVLDGRLATGRRIVGVRLGEVSGMGLADAVRNRLRPAKRRCSERMSGSYFFGLARPGSILRKQLTRMRSFPSFSNVWNTLMLSSSGMPP